MYPCDARGMGRTPPRARRRLVLAVVLLAFAYLIAAPGSSALAEFGSAQPLGKGGNGGGQGGGHANGGGQGGGNGGGHGNGGGGGNSGAAGGGHGNGGG